MKMFSDCSGPCETCQTHYTGGCLAGHGDDEYVHADPEWIERFKSKRIRCELHYAVAMAYDELEAGRSVAILVPDMRWVHEANTYRGDDRRVHVRATTFRGSLLTLRVDTLILVGQWEDSWNAGNAKLVRTTFTSLSRLPVVISIGQSRPPFKEAT